MVKVKLESRFLRKAFPKIRENCCLCGRPTRFWHAHKTRDCALCPDCALDAKTTDIPLKKDWCNNPLKETITPPKVRIGIIRRSINVEPRKLKTDDQGRINVKGVGWVKPEEYFAPSKDMVVLHGMEIEQELLKALTAEVAKELGIKRP